MDEVRKILIVDDNINNLKVLGEILEQVGFDVRPALSGEIALAAVDVDIPDLILLDIRMPGINGYETCKRLKAKESTRNIPVIFISANEDIEHKLKAFEFGGVDYIVKPFNDLEVLARVRTHIQLSQLENLKHEITERKRAEEIVKELNENLEKKVEQRTHELKKSNESLNILNLSLEKTLRELTEAQKKLLLSEKLAILGQLAAGMTHELNTPLGSIMSSNDAILDILHSEMKHIPSILANLNKEDMNRFNTMLEESMMHSTISEGFPDRTIKKNLIHFLKEAGIKGYEEIATMVMDTGIYQLGDRLIYLLSTDKCKEILSVVCSFSTILQLSNIISVATGKVSHVVEALKSYLNPNGKGLDDNNSEIDIKSEIETILTLYHSKIKYGVEVIQTYETKEKCMGNKDKLNQVWINILNNGLQAMSYKGKLEIKTELNDSWIVVSFIDSGIGIPNEIQDKIFDPFFTTKKHGEGIGIGLDISKKIIANSGGKIEFESYPGRTRFSVWLKSARTI